MTWNYRIIDHGEWRGLHEVYYDNKRRPTGYTENPTTFVENDDEEDGITGGLEMALRDANELPRLDAKLFDLPIAMRPRFDRRKSEES